MHGILHTPIPTLAAMGVGAVGLIAGAAFATLASRDKLDKARRLMAIAIRYESEADSTYAKIRALSEPTSQVPVVVLFPPTIGQRVRQAIADVYERRAYERRTAERERAEQPVNWAEGELRRIIDQAEAGENEPATPYAQPEPAAPVVLQVVPSHHVALPAESGELPARRRWSPRAAQRLGGVIPVPDVFPSLRSVPTQRKATPLAIARRLEQLPDDTRQWRVKVAVAAG